VVTQQWPDPEVKGDTLEMNVLSAECDAELKCWDLFSERSDGDFAWIRDEKSGRYLFRVTLAVADFDLKNMLRYGREQFGDGRAYGEKFVRQQMRALIGAAPLEPTE
jgi:hypothetical protein